MGIARIVRGALSVFLAGALLFFFCAVGAAEETVPPTMQTEPVLEETQTTPPEPTASPTLPPETVPQTLPPETVPETTAPAQPETPVSVRVAKTYREGTDGIVLVGTVTFSGYGLTVLQDITGGIPLTLPEDLHPEAGMILRVTGCRSGEGLTVSRYACLGTEALPETEAELSNLPQWERVVLTEAAYFGGFLIREGKQVSLIPEKPQGIRDGEQVTVRGVLHKGTFYADSVQAQPREPARRDTITAMPSDGFVPLGEQITLVCPVEGAQLFYSYSYDGTFFSDEALYSGGIPMDSRENQLYLRAHWVSETGQTGGMTEFFFARPASAAERPAASVSGSAPVTQKERDWKVYFGQLHAHTALSDGQGSVEEAFQYASRVPGLDFFAVTDHGESLNEEAWQRGKTAAKAVTGSRFVGIFGYELTFPDRLRVGHISTFASDSWLSWNPEQYPSPESYYRTLAQMPGTISQFNHPGEEYGDFDGFNYYNYRYSESLQLLEVGSEHGSASYAAYTNALDKGWRVAPTNNQNNHYGSWGDESDVRTAIVAKSLSEEDLYDAMRNRRVYATEDRDLEILYTMDGQIMGSVLKSPAREAKVTVRDATDAAVGTLELIGSGGAAVDRVENVISGETVTLQVDRDSSYYYLRVTQPDGDIAVTAPVWVDLTENVGIRSLTAAQKEYTEGEPIPLALTLYNEESQILTLRSIECFANGESIYRDYAPEAVPKLQEKDYLFSYTPNGYGNVTIRAVVVADTGGGSRELSEKLELYVNPKPLEGETVTIAEARRGETGALYKVTGWVTAGITEGQYCFGNLLFLQSDDGGIGITNFPEGQNIEIGKPLEITGYLEYLEGNPLLRLRHFRILTKEEADLHRYVPDTLPNSTATDYAANGGELVQVAGQVIEMQPDRSSFVLRDAQGSRTVVRIDPENRDETTLSAQVSAGRWIRAMGILWKEGENGSAVVRVRNCGEVVHVPPTAASTLTRPDPSNPKTGEYAAAVPFGGTIPTEVLLFVLATTASGLIALYRMKRSRR